jgi:hypothetical protein
MQLVQALLEAEPVEEENAPAPQLAQEAWPANSEK